MSSTSTLIDAAREMITPAAVEKAAAATRESPENTRGALQGAVPTIFAGLLAQGTSSPGGTAGLFGSLTGSGTAGEALMGKVFGDRSGAVSNALAKSSGVQSDSAARILSFAFPMVAGLLGKHIVSNRLSPGGISQVLASQKKAIGEDPYTPPGLASALGVGSLSELGGTRAGVAEPSGGRAATASRPRRWGIILPALLVGGLAFWGIFGLTQGHAPRPGVTAPQVRMPALPKIGVPEIPKPRVELPKVELPTAGPITLPGGKTLDVDPNGPAAGMARALGNPSTPLPQTFEFDTLNFDSGTSTATAESTKTIDELATILQAYPSARVRLVGHTDDIGNPGANRALSASRASAVAGMLASRGLGSDRIESAGSGQQGPGGEIPSPEQLARDRRVDVVLLSR